MPRNTEEINLKITGDTSEANAALKDFLHMWGQMGRELNRLKGEVEGSSNGLEKVADSAKQAGEEGKQASGGLGALLGMIMQINPATLLAALGLGGLIVKLNQLKGEIMGVVDQAQTLAINLESLAARELVKAGEFETAADAMGKAEVAAQGLLMRLQEIGIESPYTNQRVVETFRLAMAYGWASNEAMALTRAMLDMAAAGGKSGWEMTRISMNLGQIRSKGKIAGQELRDLAGLGIDLNEILRRQLNVSVEQFNEGLKAGKFTMADFAGAVEQYVSTNFAGAAKKLASTITGIKSSLQDLKEISFTKLFKDAADVITGRLAAGVGKLSDLVLRSGWLDAAGKKLTQLVERLFEAGDAITKGIGKALRELVGSDGWGFKDFLSDTVYWLREFVQNVKGIGAAIARFVKPAFDALGRALRSLPWADMLKHLRDTYNVILSTINNLLSALRALLQSEGPRAVDPLREAWIDVLTLIAMTWDRFIAGAVSWGWNLIVNLANGIIRAANAVLTKAMNIVGKIIGWFIKPGSPPKKGPLSHIVEWGRGLIETYANAFKLADFGVLKEALAPLRQALQDAVMAGTMTEADYLSTYGAAREQIAALVKDFRETGEISEDLLGTIYDTLGEGSEELIRYLELQLRYQQALEHLTAIQQEVAAAEQAGFVSRELRDRLEAAEAEASAIKEQVAWQEEYLALQRESVDIQLRLVKALEDLAKAGAGGAGGAEAGAKAGGGAGELEMPALDFESGLDEFIAGVEELDFAKFDEFNKAVSGVSEEFRLMRERVKSFLDLPLEGKLQRVAGWMEKQTGLPFLTWYNRAKSFYDLPLEGKLEAITWWLQEATGIPFLDWTQAALPFMELPLEVKIQTLAEWLQTTTGIPFLDWWQSLTAFLSGVSLPTLGEVAEAVGTTLGNALQSVGTFIETRLLPIWQNITSFLENHWWPLLEAIGNFIGSVFNLVLRYLWQHLQDIATIIVTNLQPVWDTLRASFETMWEVISGALGPILQDLWQYLTDVWDVISTSLQPVIDTLKEAFGTMADVVGGAVTEALTWLNDKVLAPMVDWFSTIGEKVDAAREWFQGLADKINAIKIPSWLEGRSPPPMATWLLSIAEAGEEELAKALETVQSKLDDVLGPALEDMRELINNKVIPTLGSLERTLQSDVAPAFQAVRDKVALVVKPALEDLRSFIVDTLQPALSGLKTFIVDEMLAAWQSLRDKVVDVVQPALVALNDYLDLTFEDVIISVKDNAIDPLGLSFDYLAGAIKGAYDWFKLLSGAMADWSPPDSIVGHSPPPMANWFQDIADATRAADEAVRDWGASLNSRIFKGLRMPAAVGVLGGSGVTIYGGLNFPNVRDGRDALSVRRELQRIGEESAAVSKVKGVLNNG